MSAGPAAVRFDAIVVGAGVAGLTAACVLARAGRRVALLEAGAECGGLCRAVRAGGLSWDLSLYSLRGGGPGQPLAELLEELGIAGTVPLRHAATSYLVRTGSGELPFTTERERMLEAAECLAPRGADRLGPFLKRVLAFSPIRDYGALSHLSFAEAAAEAGIGGGLLSALAAPLMISLGLPPGRASAYFAFLKYRLILARGAFYPEGGAEGFVRALEDLFAMLRGSIFLGHRVDSVAVDADGSKRVSAAGRTFVADALVLAVDATTALSWLAPALPERLREKPSRLTPGLSAQVLLFAAPAAALLTTELARAPQVIAVRDADLEAVHRRLRAGDEDAAGGVVGVTSPAAWEPAAARAGQQPLAAFFLAPPPGAGGADPDARELSRRLRCAFPELANGVTAHASWGPRRLAAETGNRGGSFCGWEMGPERYGPDRIPAKLPVPGVHLAGHWTDPGPSVLNAMLSGRNAARSILG